MLHERTPSHEELRSTSTVRTYDENGQMDVHVDQSVEELAFRLCPFWTGGLVWSMFALGPWGALLFIKLAQSFVAPTTAKVFVGFAIAGFIGAMLLLLLWRIVTRPLHAPRIQIFRDCIVFPKNFDSAKGCQIPYEDVRSITTLGKASAKKLLVDTKEHIFVYPLDSFVDSNPIERLRVRIAEYFLRRHEGIAQLEQMKARELLGETLFQKTPIYTYVLIALCGILFLVEQFSGALEDPLKLIALGANAPVLVQEGQLSRLISATFLHINNLHLVVNSLALLSLGALLERLVGPWRFLLIFGAGALGGSYASFVASSALLSVGASTALFGLFGSLALINWRFRESLPGGFRQTRMWWLYMLGINAAIPLLVPQIDSAAHIGGFLAGIFLTEILCLNNSSIDRRTPSPNWVKAAACLIAVSIMATMLHLGASLLYPNTDAQLHDAQKLAEANSANSDALNMIAWSIVTSPKSNSQSLTFAEDIAKRAVEIEPNGSAVLDTLATAYYRLGKLKPAVITEFRAIEMAKSRKEKGVYESQVARFLAASLAATGGPLRIGSETKDLKIDLALEPRSEQRSGGRGVKVDVTGLEFPPSMLAYALVMKDERVQGIFSISTNSGIWSTRLVLPGDEAYFERWPDDTTFKVAMMSTSANASSGRGVTWDFQPMDPKVISLP